MKYECYDFTDYVCMCVGHVMLIKRQTTIFLILYKCAVKLLKVTNIMTMIFYTNKKLKHCCGQNISYGFGYLYCFACAEHYAAKII